MIAKSRRTPGTENNKSCASGEGFRPRDKGGWAERQLSVWRALTHVQTKGHRIDAVPPCSTDLAPPAFTAPCRNQIGACTPPKGQGPYLPKVRKNQRYPDGS